MKPELSPTTKNVQPFAFAYAAWLIASVATLGSVFFGEVMKLPPCTLCWYQRICLFPLTLIIATGILLRDSRLSAYSLPPTVIGFVVSVYHNFLYYGLIPEDLSPCVAGLSCTTRQIEWLGFVTIPLMSSAAFIALLVCLVVHHRLHKGIRA